MFERIQKLYTIDEFERIQNLNILLIGVGGVGGYALESLVRSGIKNITVIDYDQFEITNMNRQILCTKESLGMSKVEVALQRAKRINQVIQIKGLNQKLTKEDINREFLLKFDIVIDACDDVPLKTALFIECTKSKVRIISCMGTGNRFHPELLEIIPLKNTQNDPLAKKLRHELRNHKEALNIPVVCSKELPIKGIGLGTCCPLPMAAGALLASYVIKKEKLPSPKADI